MRCAYHIPDRAFDEMLAGARADMVMRRTGEMVIGVKRERAGTTTTMRGLVP